MSRSAVLRWFQLSPAAYIMAAGDDGFYLTAHCFKSGVRIPEDLAIVGFDGLLDTRLPDRRLVTVAMPWEHKASEPVRMLVRQIGGSELPNRTVFPVSLVEGDTA